MSVTYFNERTGDEVRLDGRSGRLESLSNWKRIGEDEPRPPVVDDGILSRPSPAGTAARREPGQVLETPPAEVTTVTEPVKGTDQRPAKNASKADWQAYARTRAQDSDEETAIDALTRDELVARYGGDE
ncbi:hypothetical protein ACFV0C_37060 [Streptomyces sp. NPDC059568]|uniref:hypothetical protein n=1 Tax=Streptomyces sp. NPDC059568 TaxID=3346868 RepID=UPI0036C8166C